MRIFGGRNRTCKGSAVRVCLVNFGVGRKISVVGTGRGSVSGVDVDFCKLDFIFWMVGC